MALNSPKRLKLDINCNGNGTKLIDFKNDTGLLSILNQAITNNVTPFVPDCQIGSVFSMNMNDQQPVMTYIKRHASLVGAKFWCIAGGFVCNLLGKTTQYNDIDVFFLQCTKNFDKFSCYKRIDKKIINIINISEANTLPDCPHICIFSILCGFDLPICMNALYRINEKWVLMALTDDGRPRIHEKSSKIRTDIRVKKYDQRRNAKKRFNPPPLQELSARTIMESYKVSILDALTAYQNQPR